MKRFIICLVLVLMIVPSFAKGEEIYIPVISKGFQHVFWLAVKEGAEDAAKEVNYTMNFIGPASETMIAAQIGMVENAILKKPDGLMLAALDARALIPVVNQLKKKKIPLVTFDSSVKSRYVSSFVATNNVQAGATAAKELVKKMGTKGTVAIIAHNAGTTSAIDRIKGFVDYIKANHKGIKLLEAKYSDGDHDKARSITIDTLRGHPELTGMYATNEGAAIGVSLGVAAMKKQALTIIGFDSSEGLLNHLKEGNIDGFVAQDPYSIGYVGMKTMHSVLMGQKVPKVISIPAVFVDISNYKTPEAQKVLAGYIPKK